MRALGAVLLVSSLLVVVGPAGRAEACSCALADPATMLEESDAAFVGTLTERPAEPNSPDGFSGVFVFEVEQWVKGDLGPQVGVHSALDGAACGLEMNVGEKAGIFLHNDNGRPSGGLCSVTSPEALLAADQPLVFDGAGPPVFLVAAETGRTRIATLDAAGRLLAAVSDDRFGWSVSVCPEEDRVVDVAEGEITVREVETLDEVRKAEAPPEGRVEQAWCLDPGGDRILAQVWNESGGAPRLMVLGDPEPIHVGETDHLDVTTEYVLVAGTATNGAVELVRIADGETRRLARGGEPGRAEFSPDGRHVLVAEPDFTGDDGGWATGLTVYDVGSGRATWTRAPMADLEVYGWIDDTRIAGAIYPVDADFPRNVAIDITDDSVTDLGLEGWGHTPVGDALVAVRDGRLLVLTAGGEVGTVAALPTPGHRLVAVLDDSVTPTISETTTTAPSDGESPTTQPQAAIAGDMALPVGWLVGGAAVVAGLAGIALVRRRRRA